MRFVEPPYRGCSEVCLSDSQGHRLETQGITLIALAYELSIPPHRPVNRPTTWSGVDARNYAAAITIAKSPSNSQTVLHTRSVPANSRHVRQQGRTDAITRAQFSWSTALDMDPIRVAYDEVYAYTMGRPGFILQHVADAFAVQTANAVSKPIGVMFGLVGLYLHVEKQFSGRQVQQVHMKLGRRKREWPRVCLPEDRSKMTVADVLATSAGPERDRAIDDWCRSVWTAFGGNRQTIIALLREYQIN